VRGCHIQPGDSRLRAPDLSGTVLTVWEMVIKDFSCCKIDEGQQIRGKLDRRGEECITQVEAPQGYSKYISAKSV
jgi:hypothetical protein